MPPVLSDVPIMRTDPAALHVVFSAECIPAFDWESIGLFYSFYRIQRAGKITRLLACSDEQLASYPKYNMDMGPTFVHKNMRFDAANDAEKDDPFQDQKGRGYASYNKPYSVTAWLEQTEVEEEYILFMDTDMFFRAPVDPVALGVERGNVVSAEYNHLYGTQSGFARRFLDKSLHPRMAQVGGFHIFHREDLRAISPLWLKFTQRVRAFANSDPEAFYNESFHASQPETDGIVDVHHKQARWHTQHACMHACTHACTRPCTRPCARPCTRPCTHAPAVHREQARWHTEMYGYVFAAATVGVTHRIRRDVMLYPGYEPYLGRPPMIMHYGSDFKLGDAYFNKMSHQQLRLETCPKFLFPDPHMPIEGMNKRDAMAQVCIRSTCACTWAGAHMHVACAHAHRGHEQARRDGSGVYQEHVCMHMGRCAYACGLCTCPSRA